MPLRRKIAKARPDRKTRAFRLIAAGLALLIIGIILDTKVRPIIKTMSGYSVQNIAARAINEAVYNQMDINGVKYENLVTLKRDNEGAVTSIESNIININKINADITENVIENLVNLQTTSVYIPLGTLLGFHLLSGRGPSVEIKVIPTGYVTTKITGSFNSAGINQTRHTISMEINVSVSAIIPGYSSTVNVTSNFQIAETIIVGNVPESFTQIMLDDSKMIDGINAAK